MDYLVVEYYSLLILTFYFQDIKTKIIMDPLYHQTNRMIQELTEKDLFQLDQASFENFRNYESIFQQKLNNIYR